MNRSALLAVFLALAVRADTLLKNESVVVGPVTGLDCVGPGITCWRDAGVGIVFVDAGNAGTVTSVSATDPIRVATGTTTPALTFFDDGGWRNKVDSATAPIVLSSGVLTCNAASGAVNGCLSSTDWTTFNGKGAGTVTAIGVTTANGVSGTSSGGATPNLTIALGAITPSSVVASGGVTCGPQGFVTDGGLTIRGPIITRGSPGGPGEALFSQGAGIDPVWAALTVDTCSDLFRQIL